MNKYGMAQPGVIRGIGAGAPRQVRRSVLRRVCHRALQASPGPVQSDEVGGGRAAHHPGRLVWLEAMPGDEREQFPVGLRQRGQGGEDAEPFGDRVGHVGLGQLGLGGPGAQFGADRPLPGTAAELAARGVPGHREQPWQRWRGHVGEPPPGHKENLAHDLVRQLPPDPAHRVGVDPGMMFGVERLEPLDRRLVGQGAGSLRWRLR